MTGNGNNTTKQKKDVIFLGDGYWDGGFIFEIALLESPFLVLIINHHKSTLSPGKLT
jgi:hypothetical protein